VRGARGGTVNRLGDWLRCVSEVDQEGELGLFSWSDCVSLLAVCVSASSVLMGALFAVARNTEGLLLVIVILLACILLVVATRPVAREAATATAGMAERDPDPGGRLAAAGR
jgi:membrane protein required for beta-lactamase induction